MSLDKIICAATEAFKINFTTFCQNSGNMIDKVDDNSFKILTTSLMDAACSAGKAGLEQFLKQNDNKQSAIEKGDSLYRFKGTSNKELLTLFGIISVDRAMYYDENNGGEYYIPLDTALGLSKDDFATLETREMVLFASASCVPQELKGLLKKCSLCNPSRTAIQNIINRDGMVMESMREQLAESVHKEQTIPPQTKVLVGSMDGVNVLLRELGKKMGRKNIRPSEHILSDSLTSYHNAMVGSVSFYGIDGENKSERLSSIYMARMPQEKSIDFKDGFEHMLATIEERLREQNKMTMPKIFLTDGHLMIKGFAKKSQILQSYEKLLDFYHTTEHLSKAADAVYGERTDLSKAYYEKWRSLLKTDANAPDGILRSLKGFQQRYNLKKNQSKELKTEITFFRKNKKLMKYHDFIRRGLPIGSGPIEAAAKTIVRQRMCRSGMSWSVAKGQYVLTVRSYVLSGQWEKAWENFKKIKKAA